MAADGEASNRIQGYCALCVSRCGSVAVVEEGRFTGLEPDPAHPTGRALCAKGRAAPELVYHPERLLYPLRRTQPKGTADPGWQRISWDEALDLVAGRLRGLAEAHGAQSVAFSVVSPSTSASDDVTHWIDRLRNAFGSPNQVASMELCGWGRYGATQYTFGAPVPGAYMPDLEHAGCILFWGYNPNLARLAHATATVDAQKRGARLIVVDPRRTVPAGRADVWLRVRPGTDAALALGIANVMLERGWFDVDFVRDWTDAPLLVRSDTGRRLTEADVSSKGGDGRFLAWDLAASAPAVFDPADRAFQAAAVTPALTGTFTLHTRQGEVTCRPVLDLVREACHAYPPERVEAVCGVPRELVERAARLLWEARPVAYYAWSGIEMQSNATQIARAVAQLYALTGSFDARGGNVQFASVPSEAVAGDELMTEEQRAKTLGVGRRPLGPARWQHVTTAELYGAVLEGQPYPVRGLLGFGANLLLSHADAGRGRRALAALDFYAHCDLFMTPTAELADVVLPVASPFEREALKIGFGVSADAQAWVQWRPRVVLPVGEARSDADIVFALAVRLGLGEHFWGGDVEAGERYRLAPSGVTMEDLRAHPGGLRVAVETRYRKYAEGPPGEPRGFGTRTGRVELYSEVMLEHGHPPLAEHQVPLMSVTAEPHLGERFPLVLTCAKHTIFCESQHRALPSLRRLARDPQVELHPYDALARRILSGDWLRLETPLGSVLARARLVSNLVHGVV
ncbi:MAG: molybdopterin-dependent oxidoreductase, partial [Deinococcales bacterium]